MRLIYTVLIAVALASGGEARADTALSLQAIADGDYVHFGLIAMTTPANAGPSTPTTA